MKNSNVNSNVDLEITLVKSIYENLKNGKYLVESNEEKTRFKLNESIQLVLTRNGEIIYT